MDIRELLRRFLGWFQRRGPAAAPQPRHHRALLAARSEDAATPLLQRLNTPSLTIDAVQDLSALPEDRTWDIALLVDQDPEALTTLANALPGERRCPIILIKDALTNDELLPLLADDYAQHLLAPSQPRALDLLDHAVRALVTRQPLDLGALAGTHATQHHRVRSSAQRDALVQTLRDYAESQHIHRRIVDAACSVADEFVMNAVYNAPVDASGQRPHRHTDRTEVVTLAEHHAADLRFACDGTWLAISITDPFGSLDPDTLRAYLVRCLRGGDQQIENKKGGAGLGLYQILRAVNAFIVNIHPGHRTEMIGLLSVAGSYRQFATTPKSFLIAVHEQAQATR